MRKKRILGQVKAGSDYVNGAFSNIRPKIDWKSCDAKMQLFKTWNVGFRTILFSIKFEKPELMERDGYQLIAKRIECVEHHRMQNRVPVELLMEENAFL